MAKLNITDAVKEGKEMYEMCGKPDRPLWDFIIAALNEQQGTEHLRETPKNVDTQ